MRKKIRTIKDLLDATCNGHMTIAIEIPQLDNLRRNRFDILEAIKPETPHTLRVTKGAPKVFLRVEDQQIYRELTTIVKDYFVVSENGDLISAHA